jgi:hypothetical protein
MNRKAMRTSKAISRRLVEQGAEAVVVFGSWVRGDAYKESDLDIHAIGQGPPYRLERYQDFLVSISWQTAKQDRRAFKDPKQVGGIIPAWRSAFIVHDPHGLASALKQEALAWRWEPLGKKTDRWVADEITGWAEEVHKLVGNLQVSHRRAASVQRSLLAIFMGRVLAAHHRLLYDTENQLWDLVSAKMGPTWTRLQSAAFGEESQSFEETCRAALQLYVLAAREVKSLLNEQERRVVDHACKIAHESLL